MSPLKTFLLSGLASVAVTAGVLFSLGKSRARELADLHLQNSRLRLEVSQRHSAGVDTRSVAGARVETATAPTTRTGAQPIAEPAADDYRDEGNATPMAALQTFAWAGDRADTEMIGRMIVFDPGARGKIVDYMNRLPAEVRARWTTPEQMAALELTNNMIEHPFPRAAFLERGTVEAMSDERVVLRLPGTPRDRSEFQRTPEGWKFAITEQLVDRFLAERSKR